MVAGERSATTRAATSASRAIDEQQRLTRLKEYMTKSLASVLGERGVAAEGSEAEPIKKVATIMVAELNKRFKLEGIPDANTLLAMKLNPTVNKDVVFSSSQRDAMNACYDLMYDKASSFFTW